MAFLFALGRLLHTFSAYMCRFLWCGGAREYGVERFFRRVSLFGIAFFLCIVEASAQFV